MHAPHTNDLPRITREAEKVLSGLCGDSKSLKAFGHHVDSIYRVIKSWQGPAASQNRVCPPVENIKWLEPIQNSIDLILTHMMLSSVFDENVDRLMAKCINSSPAIIKPFKHKTCQLAVNLRSESMRVFGHPCWIRHKANSRSRIKSTTTVWMIVFQVKGSLPIKPDDPEVFDVVDDTTWPGGLHPIGWGLVMGQADGYVLLRSASQPSKQIKDDDLVQDIENRCKKEEDAGCFLSRIIPLHVRKLVGPVGPDLPEEIARIHIFTGYREWRRSMKEFHV